MVSTIEAAILTDDGAAIDEAQFWFEEQWKLSRRVTEPVIDQAIEAWTRIRPPPDPNDTVLDVYLTNPSWFRRRVWLTSYFSEASAAAKRKFNQVKAKYYSQHQIEKFDSGDMPLIDVDNIGDVKGVNPGDAVIDDGDDSICTYEVVEIVEYEGGCIVLLKPTVSVCGLRLPKDQRVLLNKALENRIKILELKEGRPLNADEKDVACRLEDLPQEYEDIHRYLVENFKNHDEKDHD